MSKPPAVDRRYHLQAEVCTTAIESLLKKKVAGPRQAGDPKDARERIKDARTHTDST